ncbi:MULTISPECIES: D-alanine--D-alanine ligase family protein [Olsenella]|uniref:D-alanine--D-alanine ligase family protein n=1 Tax=Olsenella TaxID=133925 RepID=UPI000785E892|nr:MULTISPECIES: D-alanine--D-alanine ligase [Olsenella]KXB61825.1 D-ala D-ala ligase protein [Olsenella sp. DNF00959]
MSKTDVTQSKLVVLAGGWSDEREVSLESGEACAKALAEAGFSDVTLLDVAAPDFVAALVSGGYDVAFVAMHGRYGEDGCIQGMLEVLHLPYTFSGVLASAMGTEKEVAKAIYRQAQIPVPEGVDLPGDVALADSEAEELVANLGLPVFVKPAANGSSYGITKVTSAGQLARAVARAGEGGCRVLIESCVEGTEITVPVVGNEEPEALPVVEIVTNAEFYDLKVKYEPSELHHVIPARIPEESYARAQELAIRAHQALGCRGASRSDFIVRADGTPVILETNTIPGMTEMSLLPDSARHAGISFPDLCKRFVELALEGNDQD